jgi:hypothetical protein
MNRRSICSGLSLVPGGRTLHVAVDEGAGFRTLTRETAGLTFADFERLFLRLVDIGSIYLTVDSYAFLVFGQPIINPTQVTGVFPFPAEHLADRLPPITPQVDAICRSVAWYYSHLHRTKVRDWDGAVKTFHYRAANTISFRSYAQYQNVPRERRGQMRPPEAGTKVLQFDWTAAEWVLILQHVGYNPPADAYEAFTAGGVERDVAKVVVLARIYQSTMDSLYKGRDVGQVDRIVGILRERYPRALAWAEEMRGTPSVNFEGFEIDLGAEEYKRPNRWAQTALQLCKWELIYRLVQAKLAHLAAGDMHDSLVFHLPPTTTSEAARQLVTEIRKPCFNRYDLRPKIGLTDTWG